MPASSSHRRAFLRSAATVPFAAYVLSGTSRAAGDRPGPIRVAAIGVGGRGTAIGMQAAQLESVVACVDVHRKNAERFVTQFRKLDRGDCEIYTDYRRVLERDDIDAITCGTPDHWHARIAVDAMEAGKDVYCEKPLTLTIGESKIVADVAKRTGRIVQVGTQQRSEYDKVFLKAVAIARSERLGKQLRATSSVGKATVGGPFKATSPPDSLDFDFWLGQAPKVGFCKNRVGWNFRWWLEYSGGQVTDWGVHHTDIALWALKGEETGVRTARGKGSFPGIPAGVRVADLLNGEVSLPHQYNVAHEFDCELTLANSNSIRLTSGKNELVIEGEKGRIRVNRGGLTGKIVREIAEDRADSEKLDREVAVLYRGMPMTGHMANFFHCVRNRLKPISDVWTHSHSVNACHMANIAMFVGRPIEFDPVAYQFIEDDEANAYINRKQRSPWELKATNEEVAG